MRYVHALLFLLGAALLAVLVARNDPAAIAAAIARLSWRILIVLCFPITLAMLFDTLGWHFAFRHDRVAFRTLVSARLAGEAFNVTTASVGGEAVKAWLLRPSVPLGESLPSLIVSKTTITIAQGLFLLFGVALAWRTARPDSPVLYGMEVLLVVEVAAVAGFVATQVFGLIGRAGRLLGRLGTHVFGARDTLVQVDDVLVRFYREEPRRLALSIACHFVGWLVGSEPSHARTMSARGAPPQQANGDGPAARGHLERLPRSCAAQIHAQVLPQSPHADPPATDHVHMVAHGPPGARPHRDERRTVVTRLQTSSEMLLRQTPDSAFRSGWLPGASPSSLVTTEAPWCARSVSSGPAPTHIRSSSDRARCTSASTIDQATSGCSSATLWSHPCAQLGRRAERPTQRGTRSSMAKSSAWATSAKEPANPVLPSSMRLTHVTSLSVSSTIRRTSRSVETGPWKSCLVSSGFWYSHCVT